MAEDDCVKSNRALNRELAEAEGFLRFVYDSWIMGDITPTLMQAVNSFLNRKW